MWVDDAMVVRWRGDEREDVGFADDSRSKKSADAIDVRLCNCGAY